MTTTPTRQDVLDALLAERIDQTRIRTDMTHEDALAAATIAEMDAEGIDYNEAWKTVYAQYQRGGKILRDWRLVQSETFDSTVSIEASPAWLKDQELCAVGELVMVFSGYLPTRQHTRYVGLAPRQEEES